MFTFLFIFKLLDTAFLSNSSKFYMQGGSVSQALASKLLSHGFLSCQLQVSVHPHSLGSIYWSRKSCGCMQIPQHHHTEGMAKSAKARGKRYPSIGILHSLLSQRTLRHWVTLINHLSDAQAMRSHTSPTLHQLHSSSIHFSHCYLK